MAQTGPFKFCVMKETPSIFLKLTVALKVQLSPLAEANSGPLLWGNCVHIFTATGVHRHCYSFDLFQILLSSSIGSYVKIFLRLLLHTLFCEVTVKSATDCCDVRLALFVRYQQSDCPLWAVGETQPLCEHQTVSTSSGIEFDYKRILALQCVRECAFTFWNCQQGRKQYVQRDSNYKQHRRLVTASLHGPYLRPSHLHVQITVSHLKILRYRANGSKNAAWRSKYIMHSAAPPRALVWNYIFVYKNWFIKLWELNRIPGKSFWTWTVQVTL